MVSYSELGDAYDVNFTEFVIEDINYTESIEGRDISDKESLGGGELDINEAPDEIEPTYKAPAISIDTSGKFVEHEIIGGGTVRQKIGHEPLEINVSGVCKETKAVEIDKLRYAKTATLQSDRFLGGSVNVHLASISTSPLEEQGAVNLKETETQFSGEESRELLYTYELSCVEVFDL